MELTLASIHKAKTALEKIMTTEMNVRVAFRLSRLAKVVDDVFADIEAQRTKLVEKYGQPDGHGQITVAPGKRNQYIDEFSDLLANEKVDLDFTPIKLDLLADIKLTPLDMMALEPFIAG